MPNDLITISLSFLEGFALILSPCILPILPIFLSSALVGNTKRPVGIICGFILFFAIFTLFSRQLVRITGIDLNVVRYFSYVLLVLLGVVMLSSYLTEKFASLTNKFANTGSSWSVWQNERGGFSSGLLIGGLVAIIWTPCAGPILAAVIVQVVVQKTNVTSVFIVLAFALGAGIPMLLIAIFGRTIMQKLTFFKKHGLVIKKILGFIIILSVVYLYWGENISFSAPQQTNNTVPLVLQNGLTDPYVAPDIGGIDYWINSPPLTLQALRGKVVLIDFWTYSCINCLRTLPIIKDWYQRYHDQGLEIIGVHTPEFDFEKDLSNVQNAVKKYDIKYPVALDNNFVTWQNYHNQYWPAHYLIDKSGKVVYQHFGEGQDDITENNIRYLLGLTEAVSPVTQPDFNPIIQTGETYLGYNRANKFSSPETPGADVKMSYSYPDVLPQDHWALQGDWVIHGDRIVNTTANAGIKLRFTARKVFMVMGTQANKAIKLKVLYNGESVVSNHGADVSKGAITVDNHRLYEILSLPQPGNGVLQLIVTDPGLEIYTFTFG